MSKKKNVNLKMRYGGCARFVVRRVHRLSGIGTNPTWMEQLTKGLSDSLINPQRRVRSHVDVQFVVNSIQRSSKADLNYYFAPA